MRSKAKVSIILLILSLLSSVSCHKKNCVVLERNNPIQTIEMEYHQILLLSDISLNNPGCYYYSLENFPDGEYGLGLYIWPKDIQWKPDNSWRKFVVKMIETNPQGEHWVDHSWNLLELYKSRDFGYGTKENLSEPFLFFVSGDWLCIVDFNAPMIDWRSCTLISRFDSEPTVSAYEKYMRDYHDSIFKIKNSDTHQIYISIKGQCPDNIKPEAKLGLIKLDFKIKTN
jgi:hypothetical protein